MPLQIISAFVCYGEPIADDYDFAMTASQVTEQIKLS
jgi:hypothetical protein